MKKLFLLLPLVLVLAAGCGSPASNNAPTASPAAALNVPASATAPAQSTTTENYVPPVVNIPASATVTPASTKVTPATKAPSPVPQKLADQSYYNSAILISSDTLSDQAKTALGTSTVSVKNMPDGTRQVNITLTGPKPEGQGYILKSGEELYLVPRAANDGLSLPRNFGDNSIIFVSQGYIAQ
jgi:hypothetical protein